MNPIQPTQSQSQDPPATTLNPLLSQILHRHHIPNASEILSQGLCRTCEAQWPWQLLFRIVDPENYIPYTARCTNCHRVGFVERMVERGVARENEMRAAEGVETVPGIGSCEGVDWAGGQAGGFVMGEFQNSTHANMLNTHGGGGFGSGTNPRRRPQARGRSPGETGVPSGGFPASLTRSSGLRVGEIGMGFWEDENRNVDVGTGEVVRISRERVDIGPPRHPGDSPGQNHD
ncbi:uncharacterized protein BDV14DRAFT_197019 [Aspergillus stella-maris]|uniref:uncharacterized protein n=1 Tax=Aspergillus stella-maris TaxID=1810926 RepID=UPI003CCCC78B